MSRTYTARNFPAAHVMNPSPDLQFFVDNAIAMRKAGVNLPHLDHRLNLLNYIRIADDIMGQLPPPAAAGAGAGAPSILDWGCGYGQMSWLMKRRGLSMTSFDIGLADATLPAIPLCAGLEVTRSSHPTRLPFTDARFDAVLSCGVLEHVDECSRIPGAERASLTEIHRILKREGRFLIYQLPQRAAWQEALMRRLRLGYFHPRRYSAAEIASLLDAAGFDVVRLRRANFMPKNLTGLPEAVKRIYNRFSPFWMVLDKVLCALPLINRLAGVMEITAVKR